MSNVSLYQLQSQVSEDGGQAAPARPLQSPGQSSEVRGPADTETQPQPLSPSLSPQAPVVTALSPVTSSRSLSPLTRHKARARVPGFPQRVTQASASVNNVSETRGHYTGPGNTESGTVTAPSVQPTSPANNLSRGLLGRLLFTESERERDWTFLARLLYSCSFFLFLQQGSTN